MQDNVEKCSDACDNCGLTINTKNTEVMHQPASGKPCVEPNITNNDQRLNAVSRSMYLGRALCKKVVFNDEVNARLTSVAFGLLYKFVWNRREIIT